METKSPGYQILNFFLTSLCDFFKALKQKSFKCFTIAIGKWEGYRDSLIENKLT